MADYEWHGAGARRLRDATDIEEWSRERLGESFLRCFNRTAAECTAWSGVRVVDTPANAERMRRFWDRLPDWRGPEGVTPLQFVALMAIFANECRADFQPHSEKTGRAGYPGLTYLFDAIPGLKRSYNTLPGNRTAFDSFQRAAFREAHGHRALADRLIGTTDARWRGSTFPRTDYPYATAAEATGCLQEADFMKFRGRGFLQTTGRANYLGLIEWVQRYRGANPAIRETAEAWAKLSPVSAADRSSNDDWDRMFGQPELELAVEAVRLHETSSGGYLALDGDRVQALRRMGLRISGSSAYAARFAVRVMELLAAWA